MTKMEFLQTLDRSLQKLNDKERQEILYDFEEHFSIGLAEGKTEAEIAKELGNPKMIAKEILVDYRISQAESEKSVKHIFQAIFATISLSFFNIMFVLGPVLAVIAFYLSLCGVAIAFVLSPIGWLVSFLIGFGEINAAQSFFVSIFLFGLGLMLSVGLYYFGKFLYELLLKYIKFNLRIVKGERIG